MSPRNRIIIDTDPGIDDVLAILLALSSPAEELEVLALTVTFGNVDVRSCLRNVVAIFHILEQEIKWRQSQGLPVGFEGVTKYRPVVAVGADEPLHDKIESADYFHGRDGLAGTTTSHPHFTPAESWRDLFDRPPRDSILTKTATEIDASLQSTTTFQPSDRPAHQEILRLLRENEPGTITLVSIGPLTNFALAAAEDPVTFLRAKEVVTMGGAVNPPVGNVTPSAEFNVFADPVAAARVYALSSQMPASTMPHVPTVLDSGRELAPYPPHLPSQLRVILMSLDITEHHSLSRRDFTAAATPLAEKGSPLAQWMVSFMTPMLDKMERLHLGHEGDGAALALHDPMTIWYVLTQHTTASAAALSASPPTSTSEQGWEGSVKSPEDIRIDTTGEWTRGMTIGDRRLRRRRNSDGERPHDRGNWLGNKSGNRIWLMTGSPGRKEASRFLLDRILSLSPPA